MTFDDLTAYLHILRPDEVSGLIVGYDIENDSGIARTGSASGEPFTRYTMRPSFDESNPNNAFLKKPPFSIAKNGRLNTNPPHNQPYCEIVYVLEGEIRCAVNGEEYTVPAGSALFMAPDISHHMHTCGLEDIAVSIFFEKEYLLSRFLQTVRQLPSVGEIYKEKPAYPCLLVNFGVGSPTDHYGRMMLCNYFDPSSHSDLSTELLLQLFLTEADSTLNRVIRRSGEGIDAELKRISRYIEVHCATVTLSDVAARFGYAENYLSAAIRKRYGMSFTKYRNHICLQNASALLSGTDRSVTEIAAEVGMPTLSHFYRLFTEEYRMKPAEYRSRYRLPSPGL